MVATLIHSLLPWLLLVSSAVSIHGNSEWNEVATKVTVSEIRE